MSKICISNCVKDTRIPVRANYVNLYRWPESDDPEFLRSAAALSRGRPQSTVVDSISCRQIYLRSCIFCRKETVPTRTMRCFGRVKERMTVGRRKEEEEEESLRKRMRRRRRRTGHRRRVVVRRVKKFSCAVLRRIFRRLLFCSASVDVVDQGV